MKKRFLLLAMLCLSMCFLVACGSSENTGAEADNGEVSGEVSGEEVSSIPEGAITPVFEEVEEAEDGEGEEEPEKSRTIELKDMTVELPEGYVYGKKDFTVENMSGKKNVYTTYYVWLDRPEREYVFETDTAIMLYIYEGIDTNTPLEELNDTQIKTSVRSYLSYFTSPIAMKDQYVDNNLSKSSDGEYGGFSFIGKSGNTITTTYNDICYPKSYYGIFLGDVKGEFVEDVNEVITESVEVNAVEDETAADAEQETTEDADETTATQPAIVSGYVREFRGFVFSNDETGEIMTKNEYTALMAQFLSAYNMSDFASDLAVPKLSAVGGLTYDDLIAEKLDQNGHIEVFNKTLLYYVNMLGREFERTNIDGALKPMQIYEIEQEKLRKEEQERFEEEKKNHVHGEECYDEDGEVLICKFADNPTEEQTDD